VNLQGTFITKGLEVRRKPRGSLLLSAATIAMVCLLNCSDSFAGSAAKRLAIVYLKQIKPYEHLADSIFREFRNEIEVEKFQLVSKTGSGAIKRKLKTFRPSIMLCVGEGAYKVCEELDTAHLILAYNVGLIDKQDPFCVLRYLQPDAKKVVAVLDEGIGRQKSNNLVALARRYDLKIDVRGSKAKSWQGLLLGDAVFLGQGVLAVNVGSTKKKPGTGPVVVVTNRNIELYAKAEQRCVSSLPAIDEIIDISSFDGAGLRDKLDRLKPAAILCIGAGTYKQCKFMEDSSNVWVACCVKSVEDGLSKWGGLSGVSMFIEPRKQTEMLRLLLNKPVNLAVPYDPANTEIFVLKVLMDIKDGIEIEPLPVSSTKFVGRVLEGILKEYEAIWIIPDRTIVVEPVRKYLLEESLRRKRVLVTMMHPYTRAGAVMAVSSTSKDDAALCKKVAELIRWSLNISRTSGRIVFPPVSVSLNMRTIKKLGYELPESILNKADFVFGTD